MKVIFVCTGNTCRSPMLKFLFLDYIKTLDCDIEVDSAGTMTHFKPMNDFARLALDKRGVSHFEHISKPFEKDMAKDSVVICVSREVEKNLKEKVGNLGNIHSIHSICGQDILDPYGLGERAYDSVCAQMIEMLPKIFEFVNLK